MSRIPRAVSLTVLVGAMICAASSLQAQQAEAPAVEAIAPASAPAPTPAVTPPAPKPSPLFERNATEAPTLAAAERAHTEENRQGRHVVSMSTLTLVLVIVILVLLID
ncbi:MAG: hypothetical protein M3N43_06250 [Actinomycetota bacterium]|nr:hypothetical protein [Actinomycetota bacterium]